MSSKSKSKSLDTDEEKKLRLLIDGPTILEQWTNQGIPCHYAKFQSAIAPGKDKEPVSEFYIKGPTGKYLVDSLCYTPHGVIWTYQGLTEITPLANVRNARFIL